MKYETQVDVVACLIAQSLTTNTLYEEGKPDGKEAD
jgi:hypothetical protein